MSRLPAPAIVFADADAMPLHSARDGESRLAASLEQLAARRVTVVLCSRRTRAELEHVRQALGVYHPFVCERGAAAWVPERYFGSDLQNCRRAGGYQTIEFGAPYEWVVATLRRLADRLRLGIVGFNDMSVDQVARECGLSLLDAHLAKRREYGEVFRLLSPNPVAERRLMKAITAAGLVCAPRGGFYEAGSSRGPAAAAAVLTTLYRVALGTVTTASAGAGSWPAELDGGVDVRLHPGGEDPADWLDSLIGDIDNIRAAAAVDRRARHAR